MEYVYLNDWYYLLGAISYGLFLVQFLLSWTVGDLDIDFDGTADFDLGDLVSFKGIIHFSMGLSGWLIIKSQTFGTVQWYDYLVAIVWGFGFVVILYKLYKLVLKFENESNEWECIIGSIATIELIYNDRYYLSINNRPEHFIGFPVNPKVIYKIGDTVLITNYENGIYYF